MCKKSPSLGKSRNVPNASPYTSGFEYIEAPPTRKPFSSSLHSSSSLLSSSLIREDDVVNERVATHLKGNLLPPRRLPPLKQNGEEEDARKKHRRIIVVIVVKVIVVVVIKITATLFQRNVFIFVIEILVVLRSMRQKVHSCKKSRSNERFHVTDKRETRVSDTFSFPFLFLW